MRPVGEPGKRLVRHERRHIGGLTLITVTILIRRLVNDGAVLEATKIKHAHATVSTAAYEDINASGTKAHIEDFLVVRN